MKENLKKEKYPMSETLMIGCFLAVIGGFLDVYTYLLRGKVFANAQTGNMVLLGLQLADRNYKKAIYYLFPIFAFFLGVVVTEIIKKYFGDSDKFHWRQIIILMELLILGCIGFIPQGMHDHVINIIISFVCSVQVSSFRKLEGNAYATTMCTGNLRSGSEAMYLFLSTKEKAAGRKCAKYFLIISFFVGGAVLGALAVELWREKSIWLCCIGLAIVFLLLFKKVKVILE